MNNIIQQGKFTADGNDKTLKIRSDVDWIKVVNFTQADTNNNGYGVEYYWQYGMGTDMLMNYHPAADQTLAIDKSESAIQLIDSSTFAAGANLVLDGDGTNVTAPVYTTSATGTLADGGIVRLNGTNHSNLNGLDFTVDSVTPDTTFALANTLATAPGRVAGAAGHFRVVAPNIEIYRMFAPSNRTIANITAAATAVVTTLVDHGYSVGQRVKFTIPAICGMTELNGLTGNITAVTDGTFTIDTDTSTFTAFKFPIYSDVPYTPSFVVPVGNNPQAATYMDAPGKFFNQGFLGVVLTGGTTGPGGNNTDVVYWYAGKSTRIDNE